MIMNKQLYINEIQALFDDVQRAEVFEDQKMMTDAVPMFPVSEINAEYEKAKGKEGFDLKDFVMANFDFLGAKISIHREGQLPIEQHIEKLWDELTRTAYEEKGTLLKLPKPYIVPGGRFNEFFLLGQLFYYAWITGFRKSRHDGKHCGKLFLFNSECRLCSECEQNPFPEPFTATILFTDAGSSF